MDPSLPPGRPWTSSRTGEEAANNAGRRVPRQAAPPGLYGMRQSINWAGDRAPSLRAFCPP